MVSFYSHFNANYFGVVYVIYRNHINYFAVIYLHIVRSTALFFKQIIIIRFKHSTPTCTF